MASTSTIAHTGPGGISVTDRLLAAGYPLAGDLSLGGFRSENIVAGFGMTPADAVQSWTGDSIHLHTMLSTDLQEIGAGVAQAGGMTYYVIDCARPLGAGDLPVSTPGAEATYSVALNEIIVPVTLSTLDPNGDIVHVVQSGQSLWQIAIAYGIKIDTIRALNQLAPSYLIQPGDKLLIAHVGTATASPPTSTVTPSPSPPTAVPMLEIASATPTVPASSPTPPGVGSSLSGTGVAVGAIIVTALIAAGFVAWAGRSRPV
jgi:LysM repeat protein